MLKQILLLAWLGYCTVMGLIIMFTESFIGGFFTWFLLGFILPQIFGAFDE